LPHELEFAGLAWILRDKKKWDAERKYPLSVFNKNSILKGGKRKKKNAKTALSITRT